VNTYQLCRQIRDLLLDRTWNATGSVVFGSDSVHCSAMIPDKAKAMIRFPAALVYPSDAQIDPEHNEEPDLVQQVLTIRILSGALPGDTLGQKSLIGGNIPDRTRSEGRGLLELEPEIHAAIGRLLPNNGVFISFQGASVVGAISDDTLGYVSYRDYNFKGWVTRDLFFPPPVNLVATGGSGQVTLTWTVPGSRYDLYRVVLRRTSGSAAPTSITDGTGVTLSSNLATSVTNSGLVAGTYSYALFATYDQDSATPDSDDQVSSAVTRTGVSVT